MWMIKLRQIEALAGSLFVLFGIGAVVFASNYGFGTTARIGPGFFPILVGVLLIVTGTTILLRAFKRGEHGMDVLHLRPLASVTAAAVAFYLLVADFGLVPAALAACVLTMLGDRSNSWTRIAVTSLFLTIFSLAVFVWILGLQIPAFEW